MVVLDSLLHRVLCFCSVCFFLSFLFFPLWLLTISLLSHFSYVLINCLPPFFFSFTVASPLSPFLSPPLPYTLLLCPFFFSFSLFSSLSRSPSSVSAPPHCLVPSSVFIFFVVQCWCGCDGEWQWLLDEEDDELTMALAVLVRLSPLLYSFLCRSPLVFPLLSFLFLSIVFLWLL